MLNISNSMLSLFNTFPKVGGHRPSLPPPPPTERLCMQIMPSDTFEI